ncbi:hypothetical protein PR048_014596 [Dryococelus australis]|uniref:Uncharacterized protein n=1 Tax=Dryococelus australis TaxID=614101 RepID=A0ABQ9HEN8_9NEOP|nr:hypothetical protein PR048_014596 [Dryococelus australis]
MRCPRDKRTKCNSLRARNERKMARNTGNSYVTADGNVKDARVSKPWPDCRMQCRITALKRMNKYHADHAMLRKTNVNLDSPPILIICK